MLRIKRYFQRIIGFILIISIILIVGYLFCFVGSVQAKVTESSSVSQKELLKWKAELEKSNDEIYAYAVKTFKDPIRLEGRKEKNGSTYFKLIFSGGYEYISETFPETGGLTRLLAPKGFPDEKEAFVALQQYANGTLIKINWQKPTEKRNGNERTVRFEENDGDYNAIPSMVYKNGKLVEVVFGMAL